ncbi:MAG: amidohydrolase [Armatimonadota bacterium]|nr:amidohydrolase [Armatimonadota bacterium]
MLILHNAAVYPVAQPPINPGAVAIEDGRIVAVGPTAEGFAALGPQVVAAVRAGRATLVDVAGGVLTPGLIDAHTHVGIGEEAVGWEGSDYNERTNPVTPDLRAIDGINPDDTAIPRALKGGVTAVCVVPGSANVIGGTGVVIRTYGRVVDEMVVCENAGMKAALGENPKNVYRSQNKSPVTRMAVAALFREWFTKARDYAAKKAKAAEKGEPCETDLRLEALLPVVRGEIPLRAHAHRADDIATILRIAREFNLRLVLEHCTEGHKLADLLAQQGVPAIVGPTMGGRGKVELKEKQFETAGVLAAAGVLVALTTDHSVTHIEHLPVAAALVMKAGMPADQVLAAITLNPAKILGIDHRLGSIEPGKDADLVLWSGHPLDVQSRALKVWLMGELVHDAGATSG